MLSALYLKPCNNLILISKICALMVIVIVTLCCRINWYIKYPRVEEEATFFIYPFEANLWCCIWVFIFLCSLVLLFVKKITEHFINNLNIPGVDIIFIGLDSFCNQDSGLDLKRLNFRIIIITIRFLALFIIPAYGAVITSFLAVKIVQMPFRNLEEFVKNGKYLILLESPSFIKNYFSVKFFYII